jgi:YgiT-type zinc finger domain-containing protein
MTELTESLPEDLCPSCFEGQLKEARHDHISKLSDGREVTVADLACTVCDQCSARFYPAESTGRIEAAVQKALGSLSPEQVQRFVKMTGLEEDELCERLGLGAKTIYRWRRGAQRPSKSLSILLAIVAHHPDLFEWIESESWKQTDSAHPRIGNPRMPVGNSGERFFPALDKHWRDSLGDRFPHSGGRIGSYSIDESSDGRSRTFNPAQGLCAAQVK